MPITSRRQLGFNLIEVLVVISIVAIALALGVPSFESLRVRSDRSSAIIELVSAARLGRSEAALRGTPFTLCASTNGTSCSGSRDWSNGWIVFSDPDGNGEVANQTHVIKVVEFPNSKFTLTADANINGTITFGLFGYADPAHGELIYTDTQETRSVQLTYIGRLHVNKVVEQEAT